MTPPRAGVIGWPVGQSLSPRIHRFWLNELKLEGCYEAVVVPPDWLASMVDGFRLGRWRGFNVTVPHKEAIIPLLDRIDPTARAIGAVCITSLVAATWPALRASRLQPVQALRGT